MCGVSYFPQSGFKYLQGAWVKERVLTEQQHLCKRCFPPPLNLTHSFCYCLPALQTDTSQAVSSKDTENENAFCIMIMELIGPGNSGLLPRTVIYVVRKERKRVELWKSRNTPSCRVIGRSS